MKKKKAKKGVKVADALVVSSQLPINTEEVESCPTQSEKENEEDEGLLLAKFANQCVQKLPLLGANQSNYNFENGEFVNYYDTRRKSYQQFGIFRAGRSDEPKDERISDQIIQSFYACLEAEIPTQDQKSINTIHDSSGLNSPFQETPSPSSAHSCLVKVADSEIEKFYLDETPFQAKMEETQTEQKNIPRTNKNDTTTIFTGSFPKSCLKKRKFGEESTFSRKADSSVIPGTITKSVQFTPYPKSIRYYSQDEEDEDETAAENLQILTQKEQVTNDILVEEISFIADGEDDDNFLESAVAADDEEDAMNDFQPKKLFRFDFTPHPKEGVLPRKLPQSYSSLETMPTPETVHVNQTFEQPKQQQLLSTQINSTLENTLTIVPSGPFQSTHDDLPEVDRMKLLCRDEYGVLSSSMPFTDMFPPSTIQKKLKEEVVDESGNGKEAKEESAEILSDSSDDLLFRDTPIDVNVSSPCSAMSEKPLDVVVAISNVREQSKEDLTRVSSEAVPQYSMTPTLQKDVIMDDFYASYSQLHYSSTPEVKDNFPSRSLNEEVESTSIRSTKEDVQKDHEDLLRFIQENQDLVVAETFPSPIRNLNIISSNTTVYDQDDPLALKQWPVAFWKRCKVINLPYPSDISYPYHPNDPSNPSLRAKSVIIYWVQDAFYLENNSAFLACLWLSQRLQLPIIAMILLEEEVLQSVQSYCKQTVSTLRAKQNIVPEQPLANSNAVNATKGAETKVPQVQAWSNRLPRTRISYVTPLKTANLAESGNSSIPSSSASTVRPFKIPTMHVVTEEKPPNRGINHAKKSVSPVVTEDTAGLSDTLHSTTKEFTKSIYPMIEKPCSTRVKNAQRLKNAVKLQAVCSLQEELFQKYHIPLCSFSHASHYRQAQYTSNAASASQRPTGSASRINYLIETNIHPKAAAFLALLRSIHKSSSNHERNSMSEEADLVKHPDDEVFAIITDDFMNPSSDYISQFFMKQEPSIPFLAFDSTAYVDIQTIEKLAPPPLPLTPLAFYPSTSNQSLTPSDQRSYFDGFASFQRYKECSINDHTQVEAAMIEVDIENVHIIQKQIKYFHQNQISGEVTEVQPLGDVCGLSNDKPVVQISQTYLPAVFLRYYQEKEAARQTPVAIVSDSTSLSPSSSTTVYSILSEIAPFPAWKQLQQQLFQYFSQSSHYQQFLKETSLHDTVLSMDQVAGERAVVWKESAILQYFQVKLEQLRCDFDQQKGLTGDLCKQLERLLLFYYQQNLLSALTIQKQFLPVHPQPDSLRSKLLQVDYQRYLCYYHCKRSVALQTIAMHGGPSHQQHYNVTNNTKLRQYDWVIDSMQFFTTPALQYFSSFFQILIQFVAKKLLLDKTTASLPQPPQPQTPNSATSSKAIVIPLLSPKEFFEGSSNAAPPPSLQESAFQQRIYQKFLTLQEQLQKQSAFFFLPATTTTSLPQTTSLTALSPIQEHCFYFILQHILEFFRWSPSSTLPLFADLSILVGKERDRFKGILSQQFEAVMVNLLNELSLHCLMCGSTESSPMNLHMLVIQFVQWLEEMMIDYEKMHQSPSSQSKLLLLILKLTLC